MNKHFFCSFFSCSVINKPFTILTLQSTRIFPFHCLSHSTCLIIPALSQSFMLTTNWKHIITIFKFGFDLSHLCNNRYFYNVTDFGNYSIPSTSTPIVSVSHFKYGGEQRVCTFLLVRNMESKHRSEIFVFYTLFRNLKSLYLQLSSPTVLNVLYFYFTDNMHWKHISPGLCYLWPLLKSTHIELMCCSVSPWSVMGADIFGNVNQYIVALNNSTLSGWAIIRSCTSYFVYIKRELIFLLQQAWVNISATTSVS